MSRPRRHHPLPNSRNSTAPSGSRPRSERNTLTDEQPGDHRLIVEFEDSVVVPVPPAEAFRLADMADLSAWNPAVRRSELVSGAALTVGAEYMCTVANGPMRMTAHPRLVEVEEDRLVAYEGTFGPAQSRDTIRFVAEGDGTRLTFTNISTLPRWARPLRGPITRIFHRQADRAIQGAVDYLASIKDPPT